MEHLDGRPVSASTYTNYGCRCDECKAAHTLATKERRHRNGPTVSEAVDRLARPKIVKWMRVNHPEEYARLLEETRNRVLADRVAS